MMFPLHRLIGQFMSWAATSAQVGSPGSPFPATHIASWHLRESSASDLHFGLRWWP
jgi:hypothetical protein